MIDHVKRIRGHFADSAQLKLDAAEILAPAIARAGTLMTECLFADGRILACGNGGSAADAQHFAAELVGRFERERRRRTSTNTSVAPSRAIRSISPWRVRKLRATIMRPRAARKRAASAA